MHALATSRGEIIAPLSSKTNEGCETAQRLCNRQCNGREGVDIQPRVAVAAEEEHHVGAFHDQPLYTTQPDISRWPP